MTDKVQAHVGVFLEHLNKQTTLNEHLIYISWLITCRIYLSSALSCKTDAPEVILFCVFACKLFAVERAFISAFLDNPREMDVPYFAASNMASKKMDEQRRETRVASDTAVTMLATFSESKVPSTAWLMS